MILVAKEVRIKKLTKPYILNLLLWLWGVIESESIKGSNPLLFTFLIYIYLPPI